MLFTTMRNLLKTWCCNCVRVQGKKVSVLSEEDMRQFAMNPVAPAPMAAAVPVAAALPVASGDSIYAQRPS